MIEIGNGERNYLLHVGNRRIPFQIEFRSRKKLSISVYPELRLEVICPTGYSTDQVLLKVEKRASWVLRQWRYFEQFLPRQPELRFVAGETHLYLGRQYRLKIHASEQESVKLSGGFFHVRSTFHDDPTRTKDLMEQWYRTHAEKLFQKRLRVCTDACPSLRSTTASKIAVRKMTYRWGSCTRSKSIILNLDLVKVPIHCVDYVVVHELCHLKIHDHSPAFYRLLGRCMPDWELRKKRLEEFRI